MRTKVMLGIDLAVDFVTALGVLGTIVLIGLQASVPTSALTVTVR